MSSVVLKTQKHKTKGYSFTSEHAGTTQKVEVTEKTPDDKYYVEFADGHDEHVTYIELINMLQCQEEDGNELWTFQ